MNETLVRLKQVSAQTGIANSTIWKYVKLKQFPTPYKLSMRVTVWSSFDVDEWIEHQLSGNTIAYNEDGTKTITYANGEIETVAKIKSKINETRNTKNNSNNLPTKTVDR